MLYAGAGASRGCRCNAESNWMHRRQAGLQRNKGLRRPFARARGAPVHLPK